MHEENFSVTLSGTRKVFLVYLLQLIFFDFSIQGRAADAQFFSCLYFSLFRRTIFLKHFF